MGSPDIPRRAGVKTKFTAVDAARIALADGHLTSSPSEQETRRLRATALMWCRDLQFPTVRKIGTEIGLASSSSITVGFGRLIDLQAAVIGHELEQIEQCRRLSIQDRANGLVRHADELMAIGRPCLRLPALVWSAVTAADPAPAWTSPDLALPLHVLAAFVEPAHSRPDAMGLRRVLSAVIDLGPGPHDLAIPA